MTTEDVTFRIKAEDEATEKIRKVTADVKQQVEAVKEVGGKAKASTELVGTLASSLGGTGLGAFAGELAMVTERVSAFSEVAKEGGKAAIVFKGGLLAAAAVLSFKLGTALGEAIFKTKQWREEILLATVEFKRLSDEQLGNFGNRWQAMSDRIGLIVDPAEQAAAFKEMNAQVHKERLQLEERLRKSAGLVKNIGADFKGAKIGSGLADAMAEELELRKANLEATKQQHAIALRFERATEETPAKIKAREDAAKREQDAKQKASTAFLRQLEREAFAVNQSDRAKAIMAANVVLTAKDRAAAVKAIDDRLKSEKKKRDKEEIDRTLKLDKAKAAAVSQAKKEANAKRIIDLRKKTADALQLEIIKLSEGEKAARSYQLQLQGLDASTAEQFTDIQETIKKATQQKEAAKAKTPDLTTKDQRLLSGRGIAAKSKQEELAEKQVKLADSQLRLAGDMLTQLEKIAEKEPLEIGTVGD